MTRVPILMYHSVTERPNPETRPLAVRTSVFAEQMSLLRDRGFSPLSLGGLTEAFHSGTVPGKPIVVTFDDGYADFHSDALPVLERHGIPATVFVTSGWLADAGRHAAGRPLDTMLSWSQVREAVSCGVEIGGHSHSHPQLDQLPDRDLAGELRTNKALLEDETGRPVVTMAYPYGYSSARVRREVARAGYSTACAVANALTSAVHDRLALPRLTVAANTTMGKFLRAVEGSGIPLIYLKERALTKGYAVVRRTRYGWHKARGRV
ncbi:polysaccharide deacetylase family protein [Sinosporangium siamense]|uniref:Polysaccharide deacetylase n=1 Tax=Sinosporangium siamense TaxID=1367973 RepID=A0A919RCP9_9ACTN|nr:polysaccharide deacetylase family protein [Sinosporangium siamense]GII91483.1 polysaccharide deacetylase [Sinosporangium siamense]